jgi:uncharacterized membrane protein YphA (DoxX/SURF4 family)
MIMSKLVDFTTSLDNKNETGYGLIRIFLGIALFVRGWLIVSDPASILELGVERENFVWIALVGIAHLLGGALLSIGFFTRLAALIQIPILFIATFFLYEQSKLMMGGQSIELSALVLFLLCVYFVFGPGPFSVRNYFYH